MKGAEPLPATERPAVPGVSVPSSGDACLNEDINFDELCSCIKQTKRGKSPGTDGILADIIKDGGGLVKQSFRVNCMLAGHFPERLSVGLITVVYKYGNKSDMSNYRGITVSSVVAKLFAMILEQRIASWAEKQLLLYADSLTLMSESTAGMQQQLDALASFCEQQRQLTVNLSKTKVVVFEARRSDVLDLVLDSTFIKRVDSYKYLGFVFHATKDMKIGTAFLVAAARKALFAMRRQCLLLRLCDPAKQCKLFDTLVYQCKAMLVKSGGSAQVSVKLQKYCTGDFSNTCWVSGYLQRTKLCLQSLGDFHCRQQILRYHHRTVALDDTCLLEHAVLSGCTLSDGQAIAATADKSWHFHLGCFLGR